MSRIRRRKESHQVPNGNLKIVWIAICIILTGLIMAASQTDSQNSVTPNSSDQQRLPGICAYAQDSQELLTVQETAKVHQLLATHPAKKMGEDLLKKFQNGEICLGKRTQGNEDAIFKTFLRNQHVIPFMFINRQVLVPGKERFAQLVIYHEYIHYQQWLEGRIPRVTEENEDMRNVSSEIRTERCKKIWYAELEAYQKECEFARAIGASTEVDVCDDDSIAQTTRRIEGSLLTHHGQTMNCSIVWQGLVSGR